MIKRGSSLNYAGLLAAVKIAGLHKYSSFSIRINNTTAKLLDILCSIHVISHYKFIDIEVGLVKIFVNKLLQPRLFRDLKIYWHPSNHRIFTYKKICVLQKCNRGTVFVYSTSRGLVCSTSEMLPSVRLGGILIFSY